MNQMQLVKSDSFNGITCDFYGDGKNDFFMTREQIGRALEYSDPIRAISKLHERRKARLDKYSVVVNLTTTDGKAYNTTLYSRKGIMEVCRHSQQPKADAFMDWVWEVMDSLMSGSAIVFDLSPELRLLINMEMKQKEQDKALEVTNARIDGISDIVALSPNSWRPDARKLIVRIAQKLGGNEYIRDVQSEIYQLVNERAAVSLGTRLTNKRRRMADEGVCKSKRDKLTKVDAIADDKKLIEIYIAIVKEMAVKHGVAVDKETSNASLS